MSHFCVIVADTLDGAGVDDQLAPFNEQDEDYTEKTVEIEAKDIKTACMELLRERAEEAGKTTNSNGTEQNDEQIKWKKDLLAKYQQMWGEGDYDGMIRDWFGYRKDDEGNYYSEFNPYAKWDWYSVGGRWTGFFKLKPNAKDDPYIEGHFSSSEEDIEKLVKDRRTDRATVGEIDWEAMRAEAREQAGKDYDSFHNPQPKHIFWGTRPEPEETREQYIDRVATIAPFAVLEDGQWYERGEMGWFGIASNEDSDWDKQFEKRVAQWLKKNKQMELTLVDCHI